MDTKRLSEATQNRLNRIRELKGWTEERTLEFAIALAWQTTESQNAGKSRRK